MTRKFDMQELAFFAVPRKWLPSIVARFGDDSDVRDAIIHFDEDGGCGYLRWKAAAATWELTQKGRNWLEAFAPRAISNALREWPDTRGSEKWSDPPPARAPEPPKRSFLCPVCDAKSLGSDTCLSCNPPPPENP